MLSDALRRAAAAMRDELRGRRLHVVLVPSRLPEIAANGGMIRAVVERNPRWYRDFCAAYPKRRARPRRRNKPDTRIRRGLTLRALDELAAGRCATTYAQRLLPYVRLEARRCASLKALAHSDSRFEPPPDPPPPIYL